MKKAACPYKSIAGTVCGKVRSHQTYPAVRDITRDDDGNITQVRIIKPSKVRSPFCKQHARPTKVNERKERPKGWKRHVNRKGLATQRRSRKGGDE